MAIMLQSHTGFSWLKYEDLVALPAAKLHETAAFLDVGDFPETVLHESLRGQDGSAWSGNSSFTDHKAISAQSVGHFHDVLPPTVLRYIECVCRPEMNWLGYEPVLEREKGFDCLYSFHEPFNKIHEKFPTNYSSDPERIRSEIQRLELLQDRARPLAPENAAEWFIGPEVYRSLPADEPAGS